MNQKERKELKGKLEEVSNYTRIRYINKGTELTGYIKSEDYNYRKNTNTGGRRYIGRVYDIKQSYNL